MVSLEVIIILCCCGAIGVAMVIAIACMKCKGHKGATDDVIKAGLAGINAMKGLRPANSGAPKPAEPGPPVPIYSKAGDDML